MSIKLFFSKICPQSLRKPAYSVFLKARMLRYHSFLFPSQNVLYCPCCNTRFRAFNGYDYKEIRSRFNPSRYEHVRQDVLCPICRSLPRHRILASWCEKNIDWLRGKRILYFAPEKSMMIWMERNGLKATTADIKSATDLILDIQDTGLMDNSYDVIIANHVLEHVDDFRKALFEIKRILSPEGCFICSFPMDPKVELLDEEQEPLTGTERIVRFGQNDHKRVFGMNADQLLSEVGYEVDVIDGDEFPSEILPVIGPADYDLNRLFCCRKKGQ